MTFGNYDAGQSRPISNPLFNGGVRSNDIQKTGFKFDFGFNKADKTPTDFSVGSEMGFIKAGNVNRNLEVATTRGDAALSAVAGDAENDRFVDEMLNPYITAETRNRIASTSFNVAMAMGDFEEAYKNLA